MLARSRLSRAEDRYAPRWTRYPRGVRRLALACSILLLGCGPRPPTGPDIPPPPPEAAPARDDAADAAFRALATEVASRSGRVIAGWGTIAFDGGGRYATMQPRDGDYDTGGAYLIEQGEARWLVAFTYDGRTSAWGMQDHGGGPPPEGAAATWAAVDARSIVHTQSHRGGYEALELAVVGGALVLLSREYLSDARDGDEPVVERHACPDCPALTPIPDLILAVRGPATTAEELLR